MERRHLLILTVQNTVHIDTKLDQQIYTKIYKIIANIPMSAIQESTESSRALLKISGSLLRRKQSWAQDSFNFQYKLYCWGFSLINHSRMQPTPPTPDMRSTVINRSSDGVRSWSCWGGCRMKGEGEEVVAWAHIQ